MQVFGSIFEIADGGHIRSIKPLSKPLLNKQRVENLELFGLLCFLLAMYGQQVDRPMTKSTIALACGYRPDMQKPAEIDNYEGDYQAVKPLLFTALSTLIRAQSAEEQMAAKSAIMGDYDYSELFCIVNRLGSGTLAGDDTVATFCTRARDILRQQIMKVIFDGPRLAAEHIQTGFRYAMASCANSRRIQKTSAQNITSTLFTMAPELIAPIFGAESGVEAEDFLNSCHLKLMPAELEDRFR